MYRYRYFWYVMPVIKLAGTFDFCDFCFGTVAHSYAVFPPCGSCCFIYLFSRFSQARRKQSMSLCVGIYFVWYGTGRLLAYHIPFYGFSVFLLYYLIEEFFVIFLCTVCLSNAKNAHFVICIFMFLRIINLFGISYNGRWLCSNYFGILSRRICICVFVFVGGL